MFFIYSKFKGSYWQNYSPNKRLKILQALEKKMAKKLHRPVLPVIVDPQLDQNCFGLFEVKNNKEHIFINENLLYVHELRFFALETIIHEGRHAYQYYIINKKHISPFNFKAKQWRKNWQGYFTANENKTIYSMQAVERDAQKFTIKMLKSLAHKYKNEKAFEITYLTNLKRYEESELNARKEYGLFYKSKINRKIENKTKK